MHRVEERDSRDLLGVEVGEVEDVDASSGVTREHVRPGLAGALEERVQVHGDSSSVIRRWNGFAPAATGSVVHANPGGGGDVRSDQRHGSRWLTETGFEHDGGAAGPGAI